MVFLWPLLSVGVQVFATIFFLHLVGKGRVLSRPLWRFRFFRPVRTPWGVYATGVRLKQILLTITTYICLIWGLFPRGPEYVAVVVAYNGFVIALYLDDYLTGDDDKWKRFMDAVRNAVKWRMKLPARTQPGTS